jgi:hypothetical protein
MYVFGHFIKVFDHLKTQKLQKRSGMSRNGQARPGTVRDDQRFPGMVIDGHERSRKLGGQECCTIRNIHAVLYMINCLKRLQNRKNNCKNFWESSKWSNVQVNYHGSSKSDCFFSTYVLYLFRLVANHPLSFYTFTPASIVCSIEEKCVFLFYFVLVLNKKRITRIEEKFKILLFWSFAIQF